jgi:hypothetical protein
VLVLKISPPLQVLTATAIIQCWVKGYMPTTAPSPRLLIATVFGGGQAAFVDFGGALGCRRPANVELRSLANIFTRPAGMKMQYFHNVGHCSFDLSSKLPSIDINHWAVVAGEI